ncbi:hypothetical protein [Tardiphaga sp. OK246]|uniref:hypothetical protein n=1 Tax=Tardiphaga sp. OK246 TaxID=1855307 RepID=UPI001AEFE10D|nr:hypothetical protein [Tardiphaga sp. OK246]
MSKQFARMVTLIREIAKFLVPVLTVIKLLIEIVNKVANCNARKLSIQVSNTRQIYFRSYRAVRT